MGKLDLDAIIARRATLADELAVLESTRAKMMSEERDLAVAENTLRRLEQAPRAEAATVGTAAPSPPRVWLKKLAFAALVAALIALTALWQIQPRSQAPVPMYVARSEAPAIKPAIVEQAIAPRAPRAPRPVLRREIAASSPTGALAAPVATDGIEVLQDEELAAISQAPADERTR
jgi:hypothetical protein